MDNHHIDFTLTKICQDLRNAKNELEELKRSILLTLKEIQQLDLIFKAKVSKRSQILSPLLLNDGVQAQFERQAGKKCYKCMKIFQSKLQALEHQKNRHQPCTLCKERYTESKFQHDKFLCPSIKIECETCRVLLERKFLDQHIKICSFRKCSLCLQKIFLKAYAYHVKVCSRKWNKQNVNSQKAHALSSRQRGIKKEQLPKLTKIKKHISLLPCSLVM